MYVSPAGATLGICLVVATVLVQQQAIELQKVVRSKCNELRQAVDIREGILSSQLDQMRQQKDAELVEKGHNLKDVVVRTQHLCSSLTQLLNEEDADPNAFMANLTIPEMQLAEMLSNEFNSASSDIESLRLSLQLDPVMSTINAIEFSNDPPAPMPGVLAQMSAANAAAAGGTSEKKVAFKTSIVLDLLFSAWLADKDLQRAIQALVAAHAGVASDGCRVVSVRAGSTVVDLELLSTGTLAATVLANLERLHTSVQGGGFHLHGVPVLTMSAPIRLKQASSQVPIDKRLDAVLATRPFSTQLNTKSSGTGPNASPAQIEIKRNKPSAVVHSEELWDEAGKVAFIVNEHSGAVSFVASNFAEVAMEVVVCCSGTNIEPLDCTVVLPAGLTRCTVGRSVVPEPNRTWAYQYKWSVLGAVRAEPQVRTGVALTEMRAELASAVIAKDKAVAEEDFVLAARLHTQCQELRNRVGQMSQLPNLSELQDDLEMLRAKKERLVQQENFLEADAAKQQILELQKIVDSAVP